MNGIFLVPGNSRKIWHANVVSLHIFCNGADFKITLLLNVFHLRNASIFHLDNASIFHLGNASIFHLGNARRVYISSW